MIQARGARANATGSQPMEVFSSWFLADSANNAAIAKIVIVMAVASTASRTGSKALQNNHGNKLALTPQAVPSKMPWRHATLHLHCGPWQMAGRASGSMCHFSGSRWKRNKGCQDCCKNAKAP